MKGLKHLVECHCILPQYRDRDKPVYHRFVAFSEIDDSDTVVTSYAQCNNCGTVHKVLDICKSEIIAGKDESATVERIQDVAMSLPPSLTELFESYSLELPDYQYARFILDNQVWGTTMTLSKETEDGVTNGKCLKFVSIDKFRVEQFSMKGFI